MASTSTSNGYNAYLRQDPGRSHAEANSERLAHRRIFVGPMPERVISHGESQTNQKKKLTFGSVFSLSQEPASGGDKTEEVARLAKAHALRFFLHEGGDKADWDSLQEESTVEELMKRWKDSEWGRLWSRRYERRRGMQKSEGSLNVGAPQWVGTSFEIGDLLGVNVLQDQGHIHARGAHSIPQKPRSHSGVRPPMSAASSTGFRSFASRTEAGSSKVSHYESALDSPLYSEGFRSEYVAEEPTPASSITGLLATAPSHQDQRSKSKSQPNLQLPRPPADIPRTQSDMPVEVNAKGKGKMVHYEIAPLRENDPSSESASHPTLPEQVLQRRKSSLDNTSFAATAAATEPSIEQPASLLEDLIVNDVVLRDRMLVRVTYVKEEGITHFDEAINRTTRDVKYEAWGEFLVAWRRDSIEIYKDHNTPGKEWMSGHKHLSYVIPLLSSKTKLSLFSFVDLTFCVTCAPTTTTLIPEISRWSFSREKEGTNIFIFKVKSRSRAYDWIWRLWRSMGGRIPSALDVYNPRLDTKVTIDIPGIDAENQFDSYAIFTRKNVIDICMDSLHNVPDWKYLIDEQLKKGHSLELAWRSTANLDWIWLENDVIGRPRGWHVLCGLALRQLASKPPSLEIRMAPHSPSNVRLKNGERVEEPSSVEGYLDRIRPNSQTKQAVYLTVHHGCLYFLNPFTASPPMPPGLNPMGADNLDGEIEHFRQAEIRRGLNQIMGATATLDLRAIVAVRRAFHATAPHMHDQQAGRDDDAFLTHFTSAELATEEDEADVGGEGGLIKLHDRSKGRMRRSFELLMKTGHVIRFEAHSCRDAIEWIVRLRALILYWRQRHRTDAQQEIELAQAQRPRLTPQVRAHCEDDERPLEIVSESSSPFPAMESLYNWCILEDCKPVVKCGRLYMRKGLRGQFKLVQLTLVAGHLMRFRISGNSSIYPVMRKKFNLLDAYVYSGLLAEQCLPKGQYNPNAAPAPRRYQDGLETEDREEDMMFMIWYRSQPQMFDANQDPTTAPTPARSVPGLSAKNKVLIFKTRSMLERDAWCWAINAEIEKIVRTQKSREEKLRETGNLVSLTQ
ncbi:hypothetical protein HYPSUDRAFT_136823 [Hypholoma sublateritium FD-334 SS-4]|uniref:PH domain-containing protein n=1 Tax=Hypholoma sublateritium (strain FD-334 SS-4) TaxID=945553 RepID=A0A0D2P5S3_HYPSF|nr:hypothetical protein HYPSUDRAFT_136823 [Hypholoma sublateritium FD-334 SS-4]